ncbi:MAG: universal stress protein [Desulfovibrionales bacterium]
MDTHLLMTVGDDPSALYGIRFVAGFFKNKDRTRLTVCYIASQPASVWADELNHERVTQMEQQSKAFEKKGHQALNKAKAKLVAGGFPEGKIETKLLFRQNTKATDIIQEAERGLYDAVVLGRRGLSRLEEALLNESVSKSLFCEESMAPLWICRKPDPDRTGILLCVDGSEPAFRMADHVGYVAAKEKQHPVTILRVVKPGESADAAQDKALSHAKLLLQENEYPEDLISTKIVVHKSPSEAILQEAEQGGFAVVATGRSGAGGCSLKNIFFGSLSYSLFRDLRKAVLWVSR